jgi:hypothetical protein
MSITTLDGALNGMQYAIDFVKNVSGTMVAGRPFTHWYTAGTPIAGIASTAGIDGEVLTAPVLGQLPFENPVSGNSYLARLQGQTTQPGQLVLIDKLWVNSGIDVTSTSLQAISASQIPSRDAYGLNTGFGVLAGIEVSTAVGAGTPTITVGYKNTDGDSKSGVNIIPTQASAVMGTFYPIGLADGDLGIQQVESITLSSSWTSGTIHVVLYRIIARLELTVNASSNAIDALTSGFPRIYNGSVLTTLLIPQTTSRSAISGHCLITQG